MQSAVLLSEIEYQIRQSSLAPTDRLAFGIETQETGNKHSLPDGLVKSIICTCTCTSLRENRHF